MDLLLKINLLRKLKRQKTSKFNKSKYLTTFLAAKKTIEKFKRNGGIRIACQRKFQLVPTTKRMSLMKNLYQYKSQIVLQNA